MTTLTLADGWTFSLTPVVQSLDNLPHFMITIAEPRKATANHASQWSACLSRDDARALADAFAVAAC
jgi:hypothetical protein